MTLEDGRPTPKEIFDEGIGEEGERIARPFQELNFAPPIDTEAAEPIPEEIQQILSLCQTTIGKEYVSLTCVQSGASNHPELVRMALNRLIKESDDGEFADSPLMELVHSRLKIPEEMISLIRQAAVEAQEKKRLLLESSARYSAELKAKDEGLLESKFGAALPRLADALDAEQSGNYLLAYLIYVDMLKNYEIRRELYLQTGIMQGYQIAPYLKATGKTGVLQVYRDRIDEGYAFNGWSISKSTHPNHTNYFAQYTLIGETEKAERCAEALLGDGVNLMHHMTYFSFENSPEQLAAALAISDVPVISDCSQGKLEQIAEAGARKPQDYEMLKVYSDQELTAITSMFRRLTSLCRQVSKIHEAQKKDDASKA